MGDCAARCGVGQGVGCTAHPLQGLPLCKTKAEWKGWERRGTKVLHIAPARFLELTISPYHNLRHFHRFGQPGPMTARRARPRALPVPSPSLT